MNRSGQPFFRSLTPTDLGRCDGANSFLQSGFWGSFKARFGWNARPFLVEWDGGVKSSILVIRRRLGPGVSFAYVPWGPELPPGFSEESVDRSKLLEALGRALKHSLPHDTAFIRFDPPWYSEGPETPRPAVYNPFKRSSVDVQPPDTVLIDLRLSEEELLGQMKSKWRYNIRLSEKKGVVIRRMDAEGLDIFYSLFKETARRDRIAIHGLDYYQTLFSQAREYRDGSLDVRLYVAEHETEPVAAIIVLFRGKEATYLYGASSDKKRNLMAPYGLQYRAMVDARAALCERYDLFGIPPRLDSHHPMAGLYQFKTGFGGTIIHRSGSWDLAYKCLVTGLFSLAEGTRRGFRSIRKLRSNRALNL